LCRKPKIATMKASKQVFLMLELLMIFGLVVFVLYWQASMRAKELAVRAASQESQRCEVQLLDQTVHQLKISLSRDNTSSGEFGVSINSSTPTMVRRGLGEE